MPTVTATPNLDTDEEIDAYLESIQIKVDEDAPKDNISDDLILHVVSALKVIKDLSENRGIIECPHCHGKLYYVRNGRFGHSFGRCQNPECNIGWMQ